MLLLIDCLSVLFPGGGASLEMSAYFEVGKMIFELAKEVCMYHHCIIYTGYQLLSHNAK